MVSLSALFILVFLFAVAVSQVGILLINKNLVASVAALHNDSVYLIIAGGQLVLLFAFFALFWINSFLPSQFLVLGSLLIGLTGCIVSIDY